MKNHIYFALFKLNTVSEVFWLLDSLGLQNKIQTKEIS